MAKKRKLSQQNSTPTSKSEAESQSQPEPEPIEEEKEEPMKVEPIENEEPEEQEKEEEEEEGEEEEEEEEEKPETLETPNPAPTNGGSALVAADDLHESDPQSIQKILEFFPKDQLVELLRDAAVRNSDVLKEIHRIADVDPAHRKIFVHGLGWDTTAESLTSFFSQYGEVEDCNAVIDKATGKSKGYGFILFKHRKGASNALKEPQKKIGTRMASCQLASAGPVPPPVPPVSEYTQRKIFISNVGADLDPQKLHQFFSKFGEIEEGPLGLDKATGKPRGFCLFVYKSVESARKALEEPHKNYEGHVLHVQKAVDGPKQFKQGLHFQQGGGSHYSGQKGNSSFVGGGHVPAAGAGHLMAPPAAGLGYNQATQPAAGVAGLNPALGQALTALLATQGAGLGLTNLLGGLGSAGAPVVNQGVPGQMMNNGVQGGYGGGGYGAQAPVQGGYGNAPMGQGGSRGQQGYGAGGRPPYMGHH